MGGIIRSVERQTFLPSPGAGVGVLACTNYTEAAGERLESVHTHISRSDTADVSYVRFSEDNGRTWGQPRERPTRFDHPDGVGRRHRMGGYVDPATGRYLRLWIEGVLPTDHPKEGMRQWRVHHAISEDGGRSETFSGPVVHEGDEFDARHPLPGVTVGRNCVMLGDLTQRPITRADGAILVPVHSSPVGPDGDYANLGGGLTYTDCLVLIGRWRPDGRLAWTCSRRVVGEPARTTRGLIEPTLGELADGRLLMVMRGSNAPGNELPGTKWAARSDDGGQTWDEPRPWTYDDGEAFFSPSACSQLVPLPAGRLLWVGNICGRNPQGNSPRYPLVVGEVDRRTGLLRRASVGVVDDRAADESPRLTLSNFAVRPDRADGSLVLHMTRLFAGARDHDPPDFTADAMVYRIVVD